MAKPMLIDTGAYSRATGHLSRHEHGAYMLLLMAWWNTHGDLPDDDVALMRITRSTRAEWRKIGPMMRTFFEAKDGKLNPIKSPVSEPPPSRWKKGGKG